MYNYPQLSQASAQQMVTQAHPNHQSSASMVNGPRAYYVPSYIALRPNFAMTPLNHLMRLQEQHNLAAYGKVALAKAVHLQRAGDLKTMVT